MKRLMFILAGALCISISASAQVDGERSKQSSFSPVTKGYYSIGNNAAKINSPSIIGAEGIVSTDADAANRKGYYSIEQNRRKLHNKKILVLSSGQVSKPTKGYYSIGNNASKL